MNYYVYIIQIDNNEFYIGSTNNIKRRLNEHRLGNHAGTKYSKLIKLLLTQEYKNHSDAMRVERKLKSFKNKNIIEKIVSDGNIKLK